MISNGIAAQSIGGGGGNGGFSVAGALSTGNAGVTASVGGFGSTGSTAGSVEVDSYSLSSNGQPLLQAPAAGTTSIETEGARSNGILAQSIGGGGGNGGFSVSGAFSTSGGSFAASVGGFGAGGGSASNVTVNSYNNIVTLGAQFERHRSAISGRRRRQWRLLGRCGRWLEVRRRALHRRLRADGRRQRRHG